MYDDRAPLHIHFGSAGRRYAGFCARNQDRRTIAMAQQNPHFIQIQAVPVRVTGGTADKPHDGVQLFALGGDGKVYRYNWQTGVWAAIG
jgi:hypothetical protein